MLRSLSISNLTTVDALFLELETGFMALTGETGAGKSVVLEAINLCMGSRAQGKLLRDETKAAEVSCSFSTTNELLEWLDSQGIAQEAEDELLLRRVISPDGRSRAFINNSHVSLATLKALGANLVEQHSQHAHFALLNKKNHQGIVDDYASLSPLALEVKQIANRYNKLEQEIQKLQQQSRNNSAEQQLLRYQLGELSELAIEDNEVELLETEYKRLGNATELNATISHSAALFNGEQDSLTSLQQALTELKTKQNLLSDLAAPIELLDSAMIQIEEAGNLLASLSSAIEADPARHQTVEQRLDSLYSIARKHQIHASELSSLTAKLSDALGALDNCDEQVATLRAEQIGLKEKYFEKASQLGKKRKAAAKKMSRAINDKLDNLSMKHCQFDVELSQELQASAPSPNKQIRNLAPSTKLSPQGLESAELKISTIPGKPLQSLADVASGGELSRISLAIQVALSKTKQASTLIFDEVDVGIGGGVAEVVGQLISELSKNHQILRVTHLAQVASKANHHFLVEKQISKKQVSTSVRRLETKQRKQELARMMSGIDVTEASLQQAETLMA